MRKEGEGVREVREGRKEGGREDRKEGGEGGREWEGGRDGGREGRGVAELPTATILA